MSRKTEHLQVRVTPQQKAALRDAAESSGMGLSAYVLSRLLPPGRLRFRELVARLSEAPDRRYVMAELSDLLAGLSGPELEEAVVDPPTEALSPYLRNYLAAMVELSAHRKKVRAPEWVGAIAPLEAPRFAATLPGLRLHLLASSPVPFRRRNLFVDASVGDRV